MKYTLSFVAIILVIAGVFLGFRMGQNSNTTNPTNTDVSSSSASNGKTLDLAGKNLTKVTADIYGAAATTELILSNNSLRSLPSEMGKMTNLVTLRLDNNLLEGSLIGEIRQMSKLKELDVSDNKMTGIPAELGQLSKLEILDYSNNKIDGLPNELANLKNNLKSFNLTGNPLSQQQIDKLKSDLPNTDIIF